MGLYFFDTSGMRELLYRDPEIGCECPLPVRARPVPPVVSDMPKWNVAQEGRFVLSDVYSGLQKIPRGTVKSLRIVAVPPKTHPVMNFPPMGIIGDDPGKCVLGTVPVEEDGSANFRVPASLILFFQALDKNGMTIQTMRSATYTQPGQTTSCIGCHESRHAAPPATRPIAAMREPSRLTPGPEGSWPMRYDRMVQPMLDRLCVSCHNPGSDDKKAAKTDLTAEKSYDTLVDYGEPSLRTHVKTGYQRGYSIVGQGPAVTNPLVALLFTPEGHKGVILDPGDRERLITWLDVYGQRLGSFSEEQERQLVALREEQRALIAE
jgi:mono/diheme cytochrome c family protein